MTPELESYLAKFRSTVADIFARTKYRSVMLTVSQYWADEADDAVHESLVASMRELPLWPHRCAESVYDDSIVTSIPGEACSQCGEGLPDYLDWWHSNGEAVSAFEAWCHESGSQESPEAENGLPCLVARRGPGGTEVSFIGKPERLGSLLYRHVREWDADNGDDDDDDDGDNKPVAELGKADTAWSDPRALQLFEQVCAHPSDDSPRRVLADYLLERDEPRGELIATALDAATNPAAKERYDALFRERFSTWFHPLGHSSPDATAVFERGFLVKCDLQVSDDDATLLRGAPVFGTVEHLRVHGGHSILHPVMRALRRVGPLDGSWIADLVRSPIAWSIEHLEVMIDHKMAIELLCSATNLPALRELWLSGALCEQAARELPKAAWWPQLQRLAIADSDAGAAGNWHKRHRDLGVPWLAVQQAHSEPTNALGWELAFGPSGACEATLRGFTPHGTFEELGKMAKQVPFVPTLVASEYYVPAAGDLELVFPEPDVLS